MIEFTTTIKKFAEQGEKTGWTYIEIPATIANKLYPNNKKSFRVKGYLDDYKFSMIALLPMGEGNFIMTLKANIRKAIRKQKGDKVCVKMEVDKQELKPPAELIECLQDEPNALKQFQSITKGHQNYFINWINAAKTDPTKAKRIAASVNALAKGWDFGQMIRAMKKEKFSNEF